MNGRLPLIYVAGPYAHPDPVENTHLAIRAGDRILDSGLAVPYVPHLSLAWHLVTPRPAAEWYAYDLELLARCDAVYRLPGISVGASAEVRRATELGIPVFRSYVRLTAWLSEPPAGA